VPEESAKNSVPDGGTDGQLETVFRVASGWARKETIKDA
jgi:hypothetical protein